MPKPFGVFKTIASYCYRSASAPKTKREGLRKAQPLSFSFENTQLRSLFAIMQDIKRELKLWLYLLLFKPLKKLKIL
jgi:hypothetical protein